MSRELLRLTKETAYGVRKSSPTSPDILFLDLQQDNAFTVRPTLDFWEIASSAASNMPVKTGSQQTNLAGRLMTYLRPSQAGWLAGMATALGSGDCRDLGSFTADYGVFTEDGTCTAIKDAYLGCKFAGMALACDNTAQGSLLMGTFDITAKSNLAIDNTIFPTPALSVYADDRPFVLQDTATLVLIDGEERDPSSIAIDVRNTLIPYRGNGRFISRLGWRGRVTTATLRGLLLSREDRDRYEAVEELPMSIAFDDGTKRLTFDFGDKNLIKTVADDVKLGDWNYQTLTLQNYLTPADGTDFSITLGDTPEDP